MGRYSLFILKMFILFLLFVPVNFSHTHILASEKLTFDELLLKAEGGDSFSQGVVGAFYFSGKGGVPKNSTEAAKWFKKSAEQGNQVAQFSLGVQYELGDGVPQDYAEAAKWYKKAANQEQADAQESLASLYREGKGVPQDYTEAAKWCKKAADQGLVNSQYNLGVCYQFGQGVPKDQKEAVKWYKKAAEQGDNKAQGKLGSFYYTGNGVPQDYTEAYAWINLAVVQNEDDTLRVIRDGLLKKMTPEQIAEGQKLSSQLNEKIERSKH